ncbi:MAG: ATP-binding cassette domain-containing protein [Lachnospiraceae bacterium]|nr:ATP-binding cassette domain-containing protein [Lachnospiraceae bacterium]
MIIFKDVNKSYDKDDKPVFENFNEKIEDGEFILVIGKSGSGKSTLIKMLLKETEPDSGIIEVNKKLLSDIPASGIPQYRRGIGVVFQDFRLFDEYTVYGNLEVVFSLTGGPHKEAESRITNLLKLLGIDHLHKRYPRELSGGEKQKVCMARALINSPYVLLADEPTGNLDPKASAEIFKLLELIHRQGTTVIMATHDMTTASKLSISARTIDLDFL